MDNGIIQIYYGDGKGKTTAALGQALRCAGRGYKVLYAAFLKNTDSGEFFNELPFDILLPEYNYGFWNTLSENERVYAKKSAAEVLNKLIEQSVKYDMIILDELLDALQLGCVDRTTVMKLLSDKPTSLEIVITGHSFDKEIFDKAECITEMKKVKHHFDKGIKCRIGIEK